MFDGVTPWMYVLHFSFGKYEMIYAGKKFWGFVLSVLDLLFDNQDSTKEHIKHKKNIVSPSAASEKCKQALVTLNLYTRSKP